MALGHPTIPDDWDVYTHLATEGYPRSYAPFPADETENIADGPAVLFNHGTQVLRVGPGAGSDAPAHKFLHKSTGLTYEGPHSVRIFTANGVLSGTWYPETAARPYIIARTDNDPDVYVGYRFGLDGNADGSPVLRGITAYARRMEASSFNNKSMVDVSASSLPPGWQPAGSAWVGLRMDVMNVSGNQVWIQCFISVGQERIENALLDDDSWLRVINYYHLADGSGINVPEPGLSYFNLNGYGGTPVYAGRAGFCTVFDDGNSNAIGFAASPHLIALP